MSNQTQQNSTVTAKPISSVKVMACSINVEKVVRASKAVKAKISKQDDKTTSNFNFVGIAG